VPEGDFRSDRRPRAVAQARAAFCFWARIRTGCSFPQIAMFMNRDHTTVMYHCETYLEKVGRYRDPNAIKCMMAVNRKAFERVAAWVDWSAA